jgi:hypothetical protein
MKQHFTVRQGALDGVEAFTEHCRAVVAEPPVNSG